MIEDSKIRVGISLGDPNGIGFEIILKTFEDKKIFDLVVPIVFANAENFIEQRQSLGFKTNIFSLNNINNPEEGKLNIIKTWDKPFPVIYGQVQKEAGIASIRSLEAGTQALKDKLIDVLVTAPINKKSIQSNSFKFPGHTDYLNKELNGESLMFMVSDSLKIALATDHIPLSQITKYLKKDLIERKLNLLIKSLEYDFGIKNPRIAVLGINPHAGDNGVIGNEDDILIYPIIKKLSNKGQLVFGPFAADGFFGSRKHLEYDAILAMYHDQGLIPFKTLTFGSGVNFTAGLNEVRTSPDHGTAFDIAGEGKADFKSFFQAILYARSIFLNRRENLV